MRVCDFHHWLNSSVKPWNACAHNTNLINNDLKHKWILDSGVTNHTIDWQVSTETFNRFSKSLLMIEQQLSLSGSAPAFSKTLATPANRATSSSWKGLEHLRQRISALWIPSSPKCPAQSVLFLENSYNFGTRTSHLDSCNDERSHLVNHKLIKLHNTRSIPICWKSRSWFVLKSKGNTLNSFCQNSNLVFNAHFNTARFSCSIRLCSSRKFSQTSAFRIPGHFSGMELLDVNLKFSQIGLDSFHKLSIQSNIIKFLIRRDDFVQVNVCGFKTALNMRSRSRRNKDPLWAIGWFSYCSLIVEYFASIASLSTAIKSLQKAWSSSSGGWLHYLAATATLHPAAKPLA